ncbi:MAG TPA: helix-turn-helix domain-containing protein [Syntrophorhabdales bacterium]|nr:helix-turn-helix domain-containing protein [Syntrophorhabdales bacterium]
MCPISSALDILGDRWTLLIIRDLMFSAKRTYGEFLQSEEGIATNVLADRLLTLEKAGIVAKKSFPGNRAKNLYQLTHKGIDLLPTLLELIIWGDKYFEIPERIRRLARQIRKNRDGAIKEISTRLAAEDADTGRR